MSMRGLSFNERRLAELIFRRRGIARVELASLAKLTGASVTRLISGLIREGLLTEKTLKDGARGQPRKILSLRRDNLVAAGFYTLADGIEAVLVDLDGKVLGHRSIPLAPASADRIVDAVRETTRDFLNDPGVKAGSFAGVGLCLPANFGSVGKYLKAHESFMKLDGNSLKEAIQGQSDWDIFLENDGTAVALGEFLFGNHGVETLFLLHVGYGLGGGAVLNGRPYRGAHGNACLPGVLFPYNAPRPTLQDFETTVGMSGRRSCKVDMAGPDDTSLQSRIHGWTERATGQVELAARIVTGMFDPELIVLGGALPSRLLRDISARLEVRNIEGPSRGLQVAPIRATRLGDLNGPIGAASIPFFERLFPGSKERD